MGTQRCSLPSPVRTSTRPVVLHGDEVLLVCQAGSGVSAGGGSDSGRPPRASREVAVCVCVCVWGPIA